jgi:hypothetical protein
VVLPIGFSVKHFFPSTSLLAGSVSGNLISNQGCIRSPVKACFINDFTQPISDSYLEEIMSNSMIQKTEVNETCVDSASSISTKNGFAKWVVVDGKLVCKWSFS